MFNNLKQINVKIRIIILLLIKLNIINKKNLFYNNYFFKYPAKKLQISPFFDLFNNTIINEKHIIIIELNRFHHECTPGYTEYFIELGFKVDILMHSLGIDSFSLFPETKNVKLLIFNNLAQIENNSKNLSIAIGKYDFILLQSTNIRQKKFI